MSGGHSGAAGGGEALADVTEDDVRNYVSRLWAEDWDSAEDSRDDEPVDPDPWLGELGAIGQSPAERVSDPET